jgi:hypothetical protein
MTTQEIQRLFRAGSLHDLKIGLLQESSREASDLEIILDDQRYAMRLDPLSHSVVSSIRLGKSQNHGSDAVVSRAPQIIGNWHTWREMQI